MRIRVLMAILASGTLLSIAACGSSGSVGSQATPSGRSLESDAAAALRAAHSVKLSGTITDNGKIVRIDLGFFRSGAVGGSIGGQFTGSSSISLDLIVTGGAAYLLVNKQYFNSVLRLGGVPASACATLCGKYLKLPARQFKSFDLNGLTNHTFDPKIKLSGTVTTSTINGQPAYRLSDTVGNYLYVAKNGTHYPIEITRPGSGTVVFSEWNSVPPISAPPASRIVSLPGTVGSNPGGVAFSNF
jgi:hypothetical protein